MFGCAGSLLLHRLLSSCSKQAQGLLSSCSVWASCGGGFSCEAQALGHVGFFFLNKVFNSDNSCLYSFTVTRALAYVILHACVLSHVSHVQLCTTLWTAACQPPLSKGFSKQEYWSGLPCPPSGNRPNPGIEPVSLMSPALAAGSLPLAPRENPLNSLYNSLKKRK